MAGLVDGYEDACVFEPFRGSFGLELFTCLWRVGACGVFDWREFFESVGFVDDTCLAEGKGVEDESLEFHSVWLIGFDEFAGVEVDVVDYFVSAMNWKGEAVGVEFFDEVDGDEVDSD